MRSLPGVNVWDGDDGLLGAAVALACATSKWSIHPWCGSFFFFFFNYTLEANISSSHDVDMIMIID